MTCPNCRSEMTTLQLEGHYGRSVVIDYCAACQAFWFDGHESVQLSAASVLRLFRLVTEVGGDARGPVSAHASCPRCRVPLLETHDQQRQSRFEYRRCPTGHGRLVTFFNFLREKDFIRPMTAAQLAELRRNLQSVNCSNCGAPIDLARATVCDHCRSPLSILDVGQAEALVERLRGESVKKTSIDPALPMNLVRARRDVEAAFAAFEHEPGWYSAASSQGLVGAALAAFTRWLR